MRQIGCNSRKQLWTKDYTVVIFYSLLVYVVHFMLIATLPLYVKEIGGDNFTVGLVMGIYSFAALISRPFVGKALDRMGRKPLLIFGSLLFLLGAFLQIVFPAAGMIFALRIIQGIGFGANTTAFGTMIADLTPPNRLAEGIGYFGITNPLGMAIGPVIGLVLVSG
jgi:MFS family permease